MRMNHYDYETRMIAERQAAEQRFEREWTGSREHLHTVLAGAWLPALQAILTGVFLGVVVLVLAIVTDRPMPGLWGLIATGVTTLAMWYTLLRRWLDLTAPIERITGWDINRDGYIGEAIEPEEIKITLEHRKDGALRQQQFANLTMSSTTWEKFCRGLIDCDYSLAESNWVGSSNLFSRGEYQEVRNLFMKRGWAEWVNESYHPHGVRLTDVGTQMIDAYVSSPTPLLPTDVPIIEVT